MLSDSALPRMPPQMPSAGSNAFGWLKDDEDSDVTAQKDLHDAQARGHTLGKVVAVLEPTEQEGKEDDYLGKCSYLEMGADAVGWQPHVLQVPYSDPPVGAHGVQGQSPATIHAYRHEPRRNLALRGDDTVLLSCSHALLLSCSRALMLSCSPALMLSGSHALLLSCSPALMFSEGAGRNGTLANVFGGRWGERNARIFLGGRWETRNARMFSGGAGSDAK